MAEAYLNQKPELSDLCEHARIQDWYQLGLQLEIDSIHLNEITCDNKSEVMKRTKMFEIWLRTNPKASVGQMADALRRKSIQENAIADEFEQIYKPHDTVMQVSSESMEQTSTKLPHVLLLETPNRLSSAHYSTLNAMAVSEDSIVIPTSYQMGCSSLQAEVESEKQCFELQPLTSHYTSVTSRRSVVTIPQSPRYYDKATDTATTIETEMYVNQKPHLSDLIEHVRIVKWYQLGIQLKLDTVLLTEIDNTNQSEDMKRSKMFAAWLKQSAASVKQLLVALRLKSVGENTIADELERKYQSHLLTTGRDELPVDELMDIEQNVHEVPQRLAVKIEQQSPSKVMAVSEDVINSVDFNALSREEMFSLTATVVEKDSDKPIPLFVDVHEHGMELQPSTVYLTASVTRKRKQTDTNTTNTKGKLYDFRKQDFLGKSQVKLDFCFSEPNTVYNSAIKIHSIVDDNGEEITNYISKSDTCSILISDQQMYHSNPEHDLPLIEVTAPLKGRQYLQLNEALSQLTFSGNSQKIINFIALMNESTIIPCDIKALVYISLGCSSMFQGDQSYEEALLAFSHALELSSEIECVNGRLVEGMVYIYMAQVNRYFGEHEKSLENTEKAKIKFFNVVPCHDTGMVYFQEALLLLDEADFKLTSETKIKALAHLGMWAKHSKQGKDYRSVSLFSYALINKAHLHLNQFRLWLDYVPEIDAPQLTEQDLQEAKGCLDAIPEEFREKHEQSDYKVEYYFVLSEYYRLAGDYKLAKKHLKLTKKQTNWGNSGFDIALIDTRLAMLSDTQDYYDSDEEWDDLMNVL